MSRVRSIIPLAAALALSAPVAWAAAPRRYVGRQHGKVVVSLRVDARQRLVTRMTISYRVRCDNGGSATRSTKLSNLRVARSGKFSFAGSYRGSEDGSTNRVKVSGRVGARQAAGKFSLTASGKDAQSGAAIHCRSGTVSWRAKRLP